MKYTEPFLEEFKKTPIFTIKDLEKFMVAKGSTKNYSNILIKSMTKKGRAYKITRGFYSLYKDIEVVGFPFYPFYYGLGFALTKHKLWKQQANPYVLTVKNVKRGTRKWLNSNIVISKISSEMFFGYYYIKGQNFYYPISDIEKTLIDCIYYNLNLEDYVYANIFGKLDNKKVTNYLKKCNKKVNTKYELLRKTYAEKGQN